MKAAIMLIAFCGFASAALADERKSGSAFMGTALQAMEADEAASPASLWILDGASEWTKPAGRDGKSCADCHGSDAENLRGIAARYPAPDRSGRKIVNLDQRINQCREVRQMAMPYGPENRTLLALSAYLARGSKGEPITPSRDPLMSRAIDAGAKIFYERRGQLNLSCAQCHDERAGGRLGGALIPQGHPTSYPIYRLEWESMGSLERRLRGCLAGVRAVVPDYGARDLVNLEAYLMWRARGMSFEGAGVRP
jgi:sulfur-oxidizing protein SoxA